MNDFFTVKARFFTVRKTILVFLSTLFCVCTLLFGTACKKELDYFSYVSEVCDNILLAKNDVVSLRAYAVNRETPYLADGIPRERTARAEIFIVVPSGDKECTLSFAIDGKDWGGDASYDNVKAQYYYSCSVDISDLEALPIKITYGKETYTLNAQSVKKENTLKPRNVLNALRTAKPEVFNALTDEYGFAGEIYIRLLYEEALYYYVGVTDREGKTHAFLLNGQTGKVLAERTT